MLNTEAIKEIDKEATELGLEKNADYSFGDIDNISLVGLNGICIRLFDKACRIQTLSIKPGGPEVNESMRDTLLDIINYARYGILLIDGRWKCSANPPNYNFKLTAICPNCNKEIFKDDRFICHGCGYTRIG